MDSKDCKPFFAFIVAGDILTAQFLFRKHLGSNFEVLDVQTIDDAKHDIVILSSCPLFDNLV